MKKSMFRIFSIGLTAVLLSGLAFAQENRQSVSEVSKMYVISAKAGGVNYVEGSVTIARKIGKSGVLLRGDNLEIGDKVSTGADGKVEILLNPGSFVRLGENSSFEFTTTSLEDLQLKLNRGSAMLEVITDNDFTFAVNTPKTKFYIIESGVYRVDILNDGSDKIEVWKGKAQINNSDAAIIKSGRQANVKGTQATVVKFDRGDKDSLELFSKSRAKELAKVNAKLQNSAVRTSLMSSFYRTRWSLYDSYGLWVYSPFYRSYCFMPFGYGWSSPYGYYYPHDIWYYNLPPVVYSTPPPQTTAPTSPTVKANGGGLTPVIRNQTSRGENQEPIRAIPPFQKVQRDIGSEPVTTRQNYPSSSPVFIPSSPAPAPQSAPVQIQPRNTKGVN